MTGEEFKDDFRKALPKELVQRLTRRSAWRATAAILEDLAVIAVAVAVAPAGVNGAVLGTSARLLCPGVTVAALLTPPRSSVETAATDSAEVVSTLWAGISFPLLGRA